MMRKKKNPHEVVFYTYPKLIFAWPLIVIGFAFWPIAESAPEVLGWLYLLTTLLVVLTAGVDLERNHAVFWLVIFGMFFFLGRWLEDAKGFYFFNNVYRFFANLNVAYNAGFGVAVSILLGIPYGVMLIWARLQHRWRITHNEFEHYAWGRADDSLARGAKRVRSTYPDLLELLLCGAGTLIVYSATGRSELRRIPHVPMLYWVRKRINQLMEVTAVTTAAQNDLLDAEESEAEEDETGACDQEQDASTGGSGSSGGSGGIGSSQDPL